MVQVNQGKPVDSRITNQPFSKRPFWVPNTDAFIALSGELIVCLELSGMQRNDFEINIEGATLRITGQRPSSGITTARTVLVHEINDGTFESVLEVPPAFDLARASSVYANGALRITVPTVSHPV
jgi:HSP20 family molecular chaperone IbpA